MNNKKSCIPSLALIGLVSCASPSVLASLSNNSVLEFNQVVCTPFYSATLCPATGGSWFAMDLNATNTITDNERTSISMHDGLVLGSSQYASGSGPGETPAPGIDNPWSFFGNTGMHFTASPTTVLSASGNTATVDFSGWRVTWNGNLIDVSSGAWNPDSGTAPGPYTDGVANVVCGIDCGDGDSFSLDYSARVPNGDASGFSNVAYFLHLEGTISAVPVPAAVWLFGSGLAGLLGVARRRRQS